MGTQLRGLGMAESGSGYLGLADGCLHLHIEGPEGELATQMGKYITMRANKGFNSDGPVTGWVLWR